MAGGYEYLFLRLAGPQPQAAIAEAVRGAAPDEAAGPGTVVLFAPQLGWANDEAALLVGPGASGAAVEAILASRCVAAADRFALAPTVRPTADARLDPGGIVVHRWFEVDPSSAAEFIELSQQGWASFERLFDARIFGLFRADAADGPARLLLITRYGSHGVWEASRDPTTAAMRIFIRRQQLTRRTWAASTRLVDLRSPA